MALWSVFTDLPSWRHRRKFRVCVVDGFSLALVILGSALFLGMAWEWLRETPYRAIQALGGVAAVYFALGGLLGGDQVAPDLPNHLAGWWTGLVVGMAAVGMAAVASVLGRRKS